MRGTGAIAQSRLPGSIVMFSTGKHRQGVIQDGKRRQFTQPGTGDMASQSISVAVKRELFRKVLPWFIY